MTFPGGLETVVVDIGTYTSQGGSDAYTGSISFTPRSARYHIPTGTPLTADPVVVSLDSGQGTVMLVASDATNCDVTDVQYDVTFDVVGNGRRLTINPKTIYLLKAVPLVDLDAMTPVAAASPVGLSVPTVFSVAGLTGSIPATSLADLLAPFLPSGGGTGDAVPLAQKGAVNGVATLDSTGHIPTGQLPALTISGTPTVVNSQAAMLALAATPGNVAIRTDLSPPQAFMLVSGSPSILGNWLNVTGTALVQSVQGFTGAVVLTASDVGAAPAARALTSTDGSLTGTGNLTADRDLSVAANKTVQKVEIAKSGALIGTRKRINLIEGANVTLTAADNSAGDRVDVTVTSSGSGGSSDPTRLNAAVLWSPTDQGGTTDMTAELEAFRLAHPGKLIQVQSGATIRLNNAFAAVTTGDILIDLTGVTVLYDNTATAAIVCNNTSNASAEVTVTSLALAQVNGNAYVTRATVGSTMAAKKFSWMALYSNDANPARAGGYLGEIAQILNDEASLQIALTRRLNRHSSYVTAVKARLLDSTRRVRIIGGTFRANGNTEDTTITTRADAIQIIGHVDPIVENVAFDRPWSRALKFHACAAPKVRNMVLKDVGNLADSTGYTYGVILYAMCDAADIRGIVTRNARHPAFTSDGNSSSSTTWYNHGIPTNFVVDGVHAINCHGSVVDTHEEGDAGVFANVIAQYSYQDPDISALTGFTGSAAQLRCSNMTIRNMTVIGGTRGIRVNAVNHGFEDRIFIDNLLIRDLTHASDADIGVQIDAMDTLANKRHVFLSATMDNVGIALSVGKKAKLTVERIAVRRAKMFLDAGAGSDVTIERSSLDWRGTTRTAPWSGVLHRSDSTNGGASVVFMEAPKVIKGSDTSPATLASEADTTAQKKLWVPEIVLRDPSSTGGMAVLSSAATTFTPATDVLIVPGFFTDNGNPGDGTGPGDPGTGAVPADILDLSNWKITMPTGSEVTQTDLNTFKDASYFHVNTAGDGVVFRANCGGGTTPNSSYPRCELREMNPGGATEIAWSKSSGTHTMITTFAIMELPVKKPQTVAGQIHDGPDGNDWLEILANGQRPASGTAWATGRMSTIPFALSYRFFGSERTSPLLLANYVMGQKVTAKVVVTGGQYSVWLHTGTSTTFSGSPIATETITGQTGPGFYFKMGDYTQSNLSKGDASTAAGEVEVYYLNITHV